MSISNIHTLVINGLFVLHYPYVPQNAMRFSSIIAYQKPIDVISAKSPRLARIGQILHQHQEIEL